MSDISTLHTDGRGTCPTCGERPRLKPDGTLVFHRGSPAGGIPVSRCPGVGGKPVTDWARLDALAEHARHLPDGAGLCRACDPERRGKTRPVWPCAARRAAWDAFRPAEVPA